MSAFFLVLQFESHLGKKSWVVSPQLHSQRPIGRSMPQKLPQIILLVQQGLVDVHLRVQLGTAAQLAKEIAANVFRYQRRTMDTTGIRAKICDLSAFGECSRRAGMKGSCY